MYVHNKIANANELSRKQRRAKNHDFLIWNRAKIPGSSQVNVQLTSSKLLLVVPVADGVFVLNVSVESSVVVEYSNSSNI